MLFLYRILINLIFIISPIIVFIRLIKRKEDFTRFKEKFCFFSKKKIEGKLIWFHGASVGELKSIIPIIEKIEKNKNIKQILLTSNTLSSSKIIGKTKFKKVIHQFFPIDTNFLSKKFLEYWKPSAAFFVDSEIWPNLIINLKNNKIPITLINGRITKKTFRKWSMIKNFSKKIFEKIDFCYASSKESKSLLKKLGVKKVKYIGNLKFSQSENEKIKIDNKLKKFFKTKKTWCASSTHNNEEFFCGMVHKNLKKKYSNLLTIIIPRHTNRTIKIREDLEKLNLKIHTHEPENKINQDTDVYLVNTYGNTKSFYSICKNVFLGGSIINRGGQNPLEASSYGCNIIHGPNISNFREIYRFLDKKKISRKITNQDQLINNIVKYFNSKNNSKKIVKNLHLIGINILNKTYKEINK